MVVGRSGSGKSSLVYAGLVPARCECEQDWSLDVLSLRPGLRALATAFNRALTMRVPPPTQTGSAAGYIRQLDAGDREVALENFEERALRVANRSSASTWYSVSRLLGRQYQPSVRHAGQAASRGR
jgi:Novel STAND NTPase 1